MSAQLGASIRFLGVSKTFGAVRAADNVNLEISAGEFVTLLGPSGSGKTTLLNIVAGFISPDAGDVVVGERSILRTPPYRRGLGIVFQSYALFPHLTVFENIAFPLQMRRFDNRRVRTLVRDALALVQLSGLAQRLPRELSGGQQQRVAFARAVVFGPQVLLMDEPLSALDRNLRQQLQLELRQLHRRLGVTILYVTHDQEEALAMSDRIAVMDHGCIIQVGTGQELYERPQGEFVARFFGESNVLEGRVISNDGGVARVAVDGLPLDLASPCALVPGADVRVVIRPDRIRLVPTGARGFDARIEESTYLGETVRVLVKLRDGPTLFARLPSSGTPLDAGREVRVTWDPGDVRVFPSTTAAGGRLDATHARA